MKNLNFTTKIYFFSHDTKMDRLIRNFYRFVSQKHRSVSGIIKKLKIIFNI